MGLDEYADAVRGRWRTVTAAVLLGGLVGLGASAVTTPHYRSTASLVFTIPVGTAAGDLARGSAYQQRQMRSISELADQPLVMDAVRSELGLQTAADALDVQVLVPLGTTDLEVVAGARHPRAAADLANAVARRLIGTVDALPSPPGTGTLVDTATAASGPVQPRTRLGVAVGLVLGAVAGVALALGRARRA